jgi:hypothetical protein
LLRGELSGRQANTTGRASDNEDLLIDGFEFGGHFWLLSSSKLKSAKEMPSDGAVPKESFYFARSSE